MINILIVEDDKLLVKGLKLSLLKEGYNVSTIVNKIEFDSVELTQYDIVLLDVQMPDANGFDLCKIIKKTINIPVVFITVNDLEEDMLKGFDLGCDDYITKPFSIPVLKEKIKVILKRKNNFNKDIYICKNITFDFDKKKLYKSEQEIVLTSKEKKILTIMIKNRNIVLTREQLLSKIWDIDGCFVDNNALNVNISRIRSKIESDPAKPEFLKTIFGIGYIWEDNYE